MELIRLSYPRLGNRGVTNRMSWALHIIIILIGALGFVGCTEGDDVARLNGPLPVRLHVSADLLGDLNASRATDPYAEEGEFMNTLCVFVVNSDNVIEAKFGPETILEGYEDAKTGDLTDWTSDELTLTTGEKTVYAFANWDNTRSEEWATLIAKEVGDDITDEDLNFVVGDPASKVDIENGSYIPMSGKETATIGEDLNYSNQLISVGLDRLVGKVTIAVQGESGEDARAVTIESLSFTGWADNVPMMSDDGTEYDIAYDKGYSAEPGAEVGVGSTVQLASFYVNETRRQGGGFDIAMQTDRYEGTGYTATTTTTAIPRNCILPLTLTLDQYELVLTPTALTSILGYEAELEYTSPIDFADNTYYITMLDVTSTFSIAPSLRYKGSEVEGVTWEWTYLNVDEAECTTDGGIVSVTSLTATPGYEYGFTLVGSWDATGGTAHSRTYNVKVVFGEGFPVFRTSRSRVGATSPIPPTQILRRPEPTTRKSWAIRTMELIRLSYPRQGSREVTAQ